jgi:glutamate--cysteine ligase
LELEWLTHPRDDPARRVTPDALQAALSGVDLPCGSTTSIEPGGQIEISTAPFPSLPAALDAAATDASVLRSALRRAGIETSAEAVDRNRAPERVVTAARYCAMEAYFDSFGDEGRHMMCNTASLQVNVDPGGDPCTAWLAASAMASVLPALVGVPGPEPTRRSLWAAIDPSRTAPVIGADAGDGWARYALAARVMFIRVDDELCEPVLEPLTFGEWVDGGHPLGWPDAEDLLEHLTTLFPPVRPRGFLELRTLDALPDDRWPAAAALAASVILDDEAARSVAAAGGNLDGDGLLRAARPALARLGVDDAVLHAVDGLARSASCR